MEPAEFMRRYEAATAAHDLEATLSMIADDAVYLFSDASSHIGKLAIRHVLSANFGAIRDETYRLSNICWLAQSPSVAASVYEFAWSGVINGEPASGSGRGTSVLRKDDDRWLVVHEHLSPGKL